MKIDSFLSLRDYFNYYISGVVWLLDFILLAIVIQPPKSYNSLLSDICLVNEKLGAVLTAALLLFVPYVVGFTLFPVSQFFRRLWHGDDRKLFPNPRKWLIIRSEDGEPNKNITPLLKGSRLPQKEVDQLLDIAKRRLGLEYEKDKHLVFHPVRVYLMEYGGESANFAQRVRDLMSLSESLLLPVSIAAGLIILFFASGYWDYLAIIAVLIVQYLLVYRYHRLEIDWVKRVYRGFLALESKNGQ